ncbi:MAG: hypothetical protein EXQ57_06160 [Bryobacterales bacterium]|nr:hypothetical protein [Bryobacterales bacterium]
MLTSQRIRELFACLNEELGRRHVRGEAYLAGGAVMCLVFQARPATKDIDAMLVPPAEMRAAAEAVAIREGLSSDWLNDAVKGFFSERGAFEVFEELSNLRIYVPHPGYLLAMKCLALRLGEEFQDLQDVAVLVRELGLRTVAEAESILGQYYDLARYPAKTRYVLEELMGASDAQGD